MSLLVPQPLTRKSFAPFGDAIETTGITPLNINQGYAFRFDDLAKIDVSKESGEVKTSLFIATPRPTPVAIAMMERHPLGSQLFHPLQDRPWLVVVCSDPSDTSSFRAFEATGRQGVNYHRGVWHFPLIVLDKDSRFIVVDRKGPGNNLEEVALKVPLHLKPEIG
jgi:ureidoglycolate lyase